MFGTIRKHQTWLWAIIITLTIISFVIFFSPYQRMSDGLGRRASFGDINGEPITQENYTAAHREVYLRFFLSRGTWPDKDPALKQSGFNEDRETYQRMLLLQKMRQMNIQVSGPVVAQLASDILRRAGAGTLAAFEKGALLPRASIADFERFLKHELGLQQLINVVGLSGTLISPPEAQALYRHENEEVSAEIVFIPATNYLERVSVTPEALTQFYTNQMARYRIPDRVQVSCVKYELTNFWAEGDKEMATRVTNLTEVLEAELTRRGTNYYQDAKSPDDAKQQIKEEIRRNFARDAARRKANEFATALFAVEPVLAVNLDKLAKDQGLPVKVSAPFDRTEGPADLNVPAAFAKAAFELTAADPYRGPILAEDGAYVMALQTNIPSSIPALDALRGRVTTDYRLAEAVKLAHQAGETFYAAATNGLAQGRNFSALCLEAKLKPVLVPPLSRATRSVPEVEDVVPVGLLQEAAFRVPAGKVSYFFPLTSGGFVIHVLSYLPLDEQKMQQDLPQFITRLRQGAQNEAFNQWFRKQAETGLRNTSLARAQASGGAAPGE